jgi:hypothetical protein
MLRRAVAVLAVVLVAVLAGHPVAAASVPPTDPPVVADNEFVPERDLSDCVSAVPQPNCGSEAKGGWRQALVFGVVVVALAFVGWRIARTVRRNRRIVESVGGR